MNKRKEKQKAKEEEINEVLIDLEKDLSNFKLNIDGRDKTIKEYIRFLTLAKKSIRNYLRETKGLRRLC